MSSGATLRAALRSRLHGLWPRVVWCGLWPTGVVSEGRLPTVCGACGARHTMLLRLDLAALGFPLTALPPDLVGLILVFCGLKLPVFAHGLGVLPVQHFRESLAHTQHIRVLALLEVVPRRQILESGNREAFRAGEGHKGEAMLRRNLKSLPTRQIGDDALLEREALRLVHGQRIARDNRKLSASLGKMGTHFGSLG